MLTKRQYEALRTIDRTGSRDEIDECLFVDLMCLRYATLDEVTWEPYVENMGYHAIWEYEHRPKRTELPGHIRRLRDALEKSSGDEMTVSRFDLQMLMNDFERQG